ncbi:peptidoglycan-binding domain-containing protein [Altererythrobacter sp. ZODW24]|uniref:peptidoglycan-binding domain-containing protein n=1 Tax=Altererythrobacter sp. ZODW24 TaxID=2185142 RepID=UPI000DF772AF|nr:peptidoglycan-binding domain-containing protein [Altererythrobacter sp. ZODW24]
MTKRILAAVAASALAATPAQAGSAEGQFAVEGAGRLDCSRFTAARNDKSSAEYQRIIGFVEGYLSAANRYETNTFDLTPWHNAAALDIILNSHCKENAGDTLVSVVQRMVTGLRPVRIAQFSPMVEVGDDKHQTVIYESILRRAQAALKLKNLYSGDEDGRFSPELRAALISFQRQSSLDPTGVPDPATLWTLLNP